MLFAAVAMGLGLATPFASLPVFAVGFWDQAEPVIIWFHLTAGLCSAAIAFALWQAPAFTAPRLMHPYVLVPMSMGAWSLLLAPWQDFPIQSLFGAPQWGMGGLWFCDVAAFTACALLIKDEAAILRRLAQGAMLALIVLALIKGGDWYGQMAGRSTTWLIYIAAYYGWLALAGPLLAPWAGWRLSAAATVLILLAAHSLTITAATALETALILGGARLPLTPARMTGAVITAALAPLLIVQTLPVLWQIPSLDDRHLIGRMILRAIGDQPLTWITGQGWGRIQDAFQVWLNVTQQNLWKPDWIFLSSDYFSSHNWLLDAVHGAGLPAALLQLAGWAAIPVWAAPHRRLAALGFGLALALISGMWFQLALSVPLTALALATVADTTRPAVWTWPPPWQARGWGGLTAAQLGAAMLLTLYGLHISHVQDSLNRNEAPVLLSDFRGDEVTMAHLIRKVLTTPHPAETVRRLTRFEGNRIALTPSLPLILSGLDVMTQVFVTRQQPPIPSPQRILQWHDWLNRALRLAPDRTDLAIPYFTYALDHQMVPQVQEQSAAMLAHNPADPVGLYYQGICRILTHQKDALPLLRQAVNNGIGRFMPLEPSLLTALGPGLSPPSD